MYKTYLLVNGASSSRSISVPLLKMTKYIWQIVFFVACLTLAIAQDRSPSAVRVCSLTSERVKAPVKGHCSPGFFLHRQRNNEREICLDSDGRRVRGGRVCRQCTACPPGVGAVRPCGPRADAVCESCVPETSYADLTSYEQPCLRCTQCSPHAVVERNCTVTHDAVCRKCRAGYFSNSLTRECVPCSFCFPDQPGLTLPVKQCAVRGQPALYRCLPIINPLPLGYEGSLMAPLSGARGSAGDRRGHGVRRRLRRRRRRRRRQHRT